MLTPDVSEIISSTDCFVLPLLPPYSVTQMSHEDEQSLNAIEEGGNASVDGDLDVRNPGVHRSMVTTGPDTLVVTYRPKTSRLIPALAMMNKHCSAQASARPSPTTGTKMDGRIIHIEMVNIQSLTTKRSKIA